MTREQILSEIRRTAALNGGTPIGVRRFLAETGISQNVWSGKYWLRWSDALREAGFSPLELEVGYSDDELLERLIPVTRELGHVPTSRELEMKARSAPDFPSEKVFRRFGGKVPMAKRLGEYSRARACLDVDAICEALVRASGTEEEGVLEPAGKEPTDGHVYMINLGKHYKIGKTFSVPRRKRTNGEWFALAPADVRAFKRRKSFIEGAQVCERRVSPSCRVVSSEHGIIRSEAEDCRDRRAPSRGRDGGGCDGAALLSREDRARLS